MARNLITRPTEGTTSQVFEVLPAKTEVREGKYLEGADNGVRLLNTGPEMLVAAGGMVWADPIKLSTCSQQYRSGSPSGSVAEAVNTKGVEIGTL